jgi:hypothetical protein
MADREKDRIISKVYFADGGFGSARETLKDVRETNPEITLKDVQEWREKYIPRKAPMRGFNSYVAPGPKHQFQVDLFEYKTEQPKAPVLAHQGPGKKYPGGIYKYGILAVDSFTKYAHVVPIDRKTQGLWKQALVEIFKKMGKPKQIYSDPDATILSNELKGYLDREGIELVTTLQHAPIAERTIRTIKSLLDKRIEDKPRIWQTVLPEVLKKYNERMVHSTIGMTPQDATKPGTEFDVKTNLEIHRISNRKYPELKKGDSVKVYKKRPINAKERVPVWDEVVRKVENFSLSFGQRFYKVSGIDRPLIRANLLKVT